MDLPLPWPDSDPTHAAVRLPAFRDDDAPMVVDLATDPYVAATTSLPHGADDDTARAFLDRQYSRARMGSGWSFCIAFVTTDEVLGQIGLWLKGIEHGRATAGYVVAPRARGRGVAGQALTALTTFAWTLREVHRIELYVERWNEASARTACAAGYVREGTLRSHQVIGGQRVDMDLFAALRPADCPA